MMSAVVYCTIIDLPHYQWSGGLADLLAYIYDSAKVEHVVKKYLGATRTRLVKTVE